MRRALAVAGAIWAALATPALAHGSTAPAPGWTFDPWVTVPLALSAALVAIGYLRLRARSEGGRPALARRGLLFAAGWLALAVAVVSPLHQAGERAFAAHMAEHELMMLVAAPLLVLSRPVALMLWALPQGARKALAGVGRQGWFARAWAAMTDTLVATLAQAAALWLWHAPALFNLALASEGWHAVQHLSFLVSALFFWTAMLERRTRQGYATAAFCLFITSLVTGALGALMAISTSPWYAPYAALGLDSLGLSPAEDQQLAGLLMWAPGGVLHALVALALLAKALKDAPLAPAEVGHAVPRV